MGATFSIRFKIENENDRSKFQIAFSELSKLISAMVSSNNKTVLSYLADYTGDPDELWVNYSEDCIEFIAEGTTAISRNNANGTLPLEIIYDFGKQLPTPATCIGAVFSIFAHHFPKATLSSDCYNYEDDFSDGAQLARLVNPHVTNPIDPSLEIRSNAFNDYDIEQVVSVLKSSLNAGSHIGQGSSNAGLSNTSNKQRSSSGSNTNSGSESDSDAFSSSETQPSKKSKTTHRKQDVLVQIDIPTPEANNQCRSLSATAALFSSSSAESNLASSTIQNKTQESSTPTTTV